MPSADVRDKLIRFGLQSLALGLVVITAQRAIAQAKQDEDQQQRIKRLIEDLASPNKFFGETGKNRIPMRANYDRQAQLRVLEAWRVLIREGYAAFPELVKHVDDERHSFSQKGGACDTPVPVGWVCDWIMRGHLNVFEDRIEPMPWDAPGRRWKPLFAPDFRKWWPERQRKTLLELQIEATEHALAEMKAYSYNGDVQREYYTQEGARRLEKLKNKNVAALDKFIAELKARKEPVLYKGEDAGEGMMGLPKEVKPD